MKIVYHRKFEESTYADDNASIPGRMEAAMSLVDPRRWPIVEPDSATRGQISLAHSDAYIDKVASDPGLFSMAAVAAGAAIKAAEIGYGGEAAFACLRPPGHHASRDGAWGYCIFNNLCIAILSLARTRNIAGALIIDIDQHTGDGTRNILSEREGVTIFNPFADSAEAYLALMAERLGAIGEASILAVSAGFDAYRLDVGHKLATRDFFRIAELLRDTSLRVCQGRRFAVLEGGYYLPDLGANVHAFCEGFE